MKKLVPLMLLLVLFSCRDKEPEEDQVKSPQLEVNLYANYEGQALSFSDIYLTQEGYRIQFNKFNFILTEFSDGNNKLFESAVYKYDDRPHLVRRIDGDYTKFNNLSGYLGVPESENHKDPAARPLTDPLNIMNTGDMHWGWNPGYIFLMIEGRIDTTGVEGNPLSQFFLYHVGFNPFLRDLAFNDITWLKKSDDLHELRIGVDMAKVFNGNETVDIKNERSSHTNPGEEPLSEKIIANFIDALFLLD